MPGLFGIVGQPHRRDRLTAMGAKLRHRGRAVAVQWPTREVALGSVSCGATGLAVLDRLAIVSDATIYGAPEPHVRPVGSGGAEAASGTATQALLALYDAFGLALIDHVDGDFACAIVDLHRREVVLARDPVGCRSLYWARLQGGGIAFASEYKALLALPTVAATPDRDMVQFLQCAKQLPPGRTLVRGIAECPPGTALRLDWNGTELARHASSEIRLNGACITDEEEAARLVRDRLTAAVRRRSADLDRIGLALSGGIDSIAVAFLLRELYPDKPIYTYTAGHGPDDPEMVTAAEVAARIGARHREVVTPPDLLREVLTDLVWHLEDPFARSDTLQLLCVSRVARDDVGVLFSAQGADTLFAGMPKHMLLHLSHRLPVLSEWLKELYDLTQFSLEPVTMPGKVLDWLYYRGKVPPVPIVLDASLPGRPQLPPLQDEYLNRVLASGYQRSFAQGLRKFDRTFAAYGLEHRSPFCDRGLAEAAFMVSDRLKIRGRQNKYVLRKAVAGIVPAEFVGVPKHPQRMKYDAAFADALDEVARVFLAPGPVRERGLFDPAGIELLFRRAPGRPYAPEAAMRVWTAVLTECWARLFLDPHAGLPGPDGGGLPLGLEEGASLASPVRAGQPDPGMVYGGAVGEGEPDHA